MFSNAETHLSLAELGSKPTPYRKTHEFAGDFINGGQAFYASCPTGAMGIEVCIDTGVEGYLQRADALKIYELAYFSEGDVLELGTHKGLSTTIIAQALNDRGAGQPKLETVDIDKKTNALARRNVAGRPGGERVTFNICDAAEFMDRMGKARREFGFIFVDHWHGYEATEQAARRVAPLLKPGGFVLFHDYLDPGNADPKHVYGVYQAVDDVIVKGGKFEFYGNFGCCGLFRKKPVQAPAA